MKRCKKDNLKTFNSFDYIYNGTQFVVNWLNDFNDCLSNIVANSNNDEILDVYGNLQSLYKRIILEFLVRTGKNLEESMNYFYNSQIYEFISEGVSDLHCRGTNARIWIYGAYRLS